MIKVSWTQLKQAIINGSDYAWFQDDNSYTISLFTGSLELQTIIPFSNPISSDQSDFETNFKSSATNSPFQPIAPKPFIDNNVSGTFNASGQTIQIDTVGCSSVQYGTVSTGWVGDIVTELSYDGTNWLPCATADTDPGTNLTMLVWGGITAPAFDNDPWEVNVAGSMLFRLRVIDYTSGSLQVIVIASPASSDISEPSNDRWGAGSIGALNATTLGASAGCSTCAVAITGTWVGAITLQASIDNVTFLNVPVINIATGLQITSITANGNFLVPCGGYNVVQALMSSYTSGSAVVTFDASEGSNTGVFPVDVPVSYRHLTGNATTTIKTGSGRLHSISINNNTTGGTITVYDNTAGSGTTIMAITTGTPTGGLLSSSGQPGPVLMGPLGINGLTFNTGLTVVTAGSTSNDFTVIYQ
jgi:hypothetical protein